MDVSFERWSWRMYRLERIYGYDHASTETETILNALRRRHEREKGFKNVDPTTRAVRGTERHKLVPQRHVEENFMPLQTELRTC